MQNRKEWSQKMDQKEFKPYIPAEKITPEITATSVITGVILAIVFGAANAYLGLRVGMTVSASIPAAVISMSVLRVIMKKNARQAQPEPLSAAPVTIHGKYCLVIASCFYGFM